MSTPFAFCLRCRVSYEQVRGNDFSKLATLDQEGRSSAMTVMASSIVRSLRAADSEEIGPDARKLLTFVAFGLVLTAAASAQGIQATLFAQQMAAQAQLQQIRQPGLPSGAMPVTGVRPGMGAPSSDESRPGNYL